MWYTNDPVEDYESYSSHQEKELDKLPRCSNCGKHIQEETAFLINDELICEGCMNENRVFVDDYI